MSISQKSTIFVVHKHHSRRLHYDLRLEKDGVLKSWAVPKEPPKVKGIKRLAIAVQDHELGYEHFQGRITEGMYGAGTVEIWDRGYYDQIKFEVNEIIVVLEGEILKGKYCLIKMKPKNVSDKNWLLFKMK